MLISSFDGHRFLLSDRQETFLGEVAFRVLIACVMVFSFLKIPAVAAYVSFRCLNWL